MQIEDIQRELAYFDAGVARLNPPPRPRDVSRCQTELGLKFPPSLRRALIHFNGGYIAGEALLGVPPIQSSLNMMAETRQARTYWGPIGWSPAYLAVGGDGCGNPFVLMREREDDRGESPVGLFDAGTMEIAEIVASTYLHFVWFMIQDTKWHHAPDGKPIVREAVVWTPKSVIVRPDALSPWRFNEAWMIANDPGLVRWR